MLGFGRGTCVLGQAVIQRRPLNGKVFEIKILYCPRLPHDQRNRFPTKTHAPICQRRLVGQRRYDTKPVFAGYVSGGEHVNDAGMGRLPCLDITQGEGGVKVRCAHRTYQQGVRRHMISAENFASRYLLQTVQTHQRFPNA